MRVIVLAVPIRLAAAAQSVYGTLCVGLATALLTMLSGVLYGATGRFRLFGHGGALRSSTAVMCWLPHVAGSGIISGRKRSGNGHPTVHWVDMTGYHPGLIGC